MMKLKIPHKKKAMNENSISKPKRSLRSKHKREKSKKTTAIKKERPKKKRKDRTARSVNTAKRFRLLTFSRKMLLLCLAPMMLICILITVFSRQSLTKSVENEIEGALKIVAISLDETYSNLYQGDYEQDKSGKIKKGDVSISGNTDLIDALKKRTNYDITLYFNGMRLVTTLRSDTGAPANGTPADSAVYEKIMKGKTVFLSNVKLYGKEYYVLYQPLVNADGTVAGGIGVAKDATDVQKTIAAQTRRITLISIVLLVLAAVVIIFLTTRMVTVMKSTKHFLAKLAQGEFGVVPKQKHVKRNDELGDIYRSSVQLQQELRKIVDNIKQSSESLINSANQLTGMAQSTRTTVDSVCDSMRGITDASVTQNEETTVAIGNVQGMANEIAYISHIMDSLTQHANQMSEAEQASEAIIHQLNASNEETIDTITNVAEQINALHSSVESIQTAINMIQSIAEETDLLSLNANIEAARAGESGRGFSVVATQISKLADQSNSTAENVADIIANIIAEADRMVEMMGDVKNKIHEQQKKLDDTMDKSGAVALGVNNSLRDIDTIRNKISVLSQSGDSIQDIVTNLASIAEQNESSTQATMDSALGMSDTMNSLENASESLKDMARALDESLVRFKM
jgi:methyl-accepting chemotaxis sensory transducer